LPKEKSAKLTSIPTAQDAVYNADMAGVGGKAGRSSYVIQVGEVDNLYKSSKKLSGTIPKFQMIDLHGYTQLEALDKLNQCLPRWEKYAMEGSYPYVAPVLIICGGGNQIISETVSKWIKQNKVSNAPKNLFARAA
jgi:DNA-nicking Smr family endonuclease